MSKMLENWDRVNVLVVGDMMLDRHIIGQVRRISPEAPVPVVQAEREFVSPGGAGNVAASLTALGCRVTAAGIIGMDAEAGQLRQALSEAGVADLQMIANPDTRTICKTRILAENHHQMLRLDYDGFRSAIVQSSQRLVAMLAPHVASSNVVVLADYDKGTLSATLIAAIIRSCQAARIPCLIDPKKTDFGVYRGATILTPNIHETSRATGRTLSSEDDVRTTARMLRSELDLQYMLITQGEQGMTLAGGDGSAHFPAEVRAVADVTGAGDTVVAVLAACLGCGEAIEVACRAASVAAGIAVSRPGTYVVKAAELQSAWTGISPKVVDPNTARRLVADYQRRGQNVVFTNGCFDILHAGHLSCLERARRLGDYLIVGLNSDLSVRLNKGTARPIITQENRAALLAGLACVDMVVLFDELTPEALVRHLAPDVLVKGGDYDPATMAGAEFVRSRGGKVLTIPLIEGLSTTRILAGGEREFA